MQRTTLLGLTAAALVCLVGVCECHQLKINKHFLLPTGLRSAARFTSTNDVAGALATR